MPAAVAGNTDGHKNTTNMILLICLFVCTRQQRPIEHKIRKIDAVRSDTAGLSPPPAFVSASSSLVSFRPCSKSEVHRLIMSSQVKSSSLTPFPRFWCVSSSKSCCLTWRRWSTRRWLQVDCQLRRSTRLSRHYWRDLGWTQQTWEIPPCLQPFIRVIGSWTSGG